MTPLSTKFGFDRGTPIDRYWIETFLKDRKTLIKGRVLEITDSTYTKRFGENRVTGADVLDINMKNKQATIYGDLRNLRKVVRDNTYDTIILTHVLGMIDNIDGALGEVYRILKPGGTLLVTSSCMGPIYDANTNFWRFTPAGARYLFAKQFGKKVTVSSYGNVFSGQAFWTGMAQEELTHKELNYNDPRYPCIVAVVAKK
jgi:SAM-dependent methyltransferase